MTWNYRIIHKLDDGLYGLYRVFYEETTGRIVSFTDEPITFVDENKDDLIASLELALKDVKERPVLYVNDAGEFLSAKTVSFSNLDHFRVPKEQVQGVLPNNIGATAFLDRRKKKYELGQEWEKTIPLIGWRVFPNRVEPIVLHNDDNETVYIRYTDGKVENTLTGNRYRDVSTWYRNEPLPAPAE